MRREGEMESKNGPDFYIAAVVAVAL